MAKAEYRSSLRSKKLINDALVDQKEYKEQLEKQEKLLNLSTTLIA